MRRNMIETVLGAVVLVVAGLFVVFAYSSASLHTQSGYTVTARFDRIGDLKKGDDVKLSGIKIGSVVNQTLDPKTYQAVVTLSISPQVKLPRDTAAEIAAQGLMGGAYVLLTPGADDTYLHQGDRITQTQGAVNLVDLIGKAMFSSKGGLGEGSEPAVK